METPTIVALSLALLWGGYRVGARERRGRGWLSYLGEMYAATFFGVYLAVRLLSPEALVSEAVLQDGVLWVASTSAWGAFFVGVFARLRVDAWRKSASS